MNIYYQTVSDVHGTAICKHSLDFSIALVSFCTCTGSNMVMVQCLHLWVLGKSCSVYFEYNMRKLACIQASSHCLKDRVPLTFWAFPSQNKLSKWETIPYCANLGTAQCIYAVEK